MSPVDAAIICALAGAAAAGQSLSGFGFSLLIVPPLALVLGAKDAVVLANLLSALSNLITVSRVRGTVDWGLGGRLLAGSLAGMPVGLLVLTTIPSTALQVAIGCVILVSTALIVGGARIGHSGPLWDGGAGFASGVLNTSTSMSGPPLVLYLQGRRVAAGPFRATLGAYFLVASLVAVLLFAVAGRVQGSTLGYAALALPPLLLGWELGNLLFGRLDERRFRQVVLAVLVVSAILAIAAAFT